MSFRIGFKKAVNRELLLKLLSVFTKNVINEDSDLEDILTYLMLYYFVIFYTNL